MNDIKNWKRTFLCGASLLLIAASPAMASGVDAMSTEGVAAVQQNGRTVTVTVNDAMGPVIGANVLVKGTTIGSITDMDGNAVIQGVPNGAVIIVSYIGYITQEINLPNGQSALTVELKEDAETLDEVVVVGYGTQAKKDITGSVAVVSRDAITEQPVATFAEALQGRASSVYINNAGGPAGDTTIRIRGVGSANGSDPLIIVDGVQGADISSVNPNDIDTMNVLKDAAATAIYGARAANSYVKAEKGITNGSYTYEDKVHGKTIKDAAANYAIGLYPAFSSETEAWTALKRERRAELSFEGHRFFDLARWGDVGETLGKYVAFEKQYLAKYQTTPGNFTCLPIPLNEIRTSEGRFVQNADWQ